MIGVGRTNDVLGRQTLIHPKNVKPSPSKLKRPFLAWKLFFAFKELHLSRTQSRYAGLGTRQSCIYILIEKIFRVDS